MSMGRDNNTDAKRLQTLERWRSSELEGAQADYMKLAQVAAEKAAARDRLRCDVADTQTLIRKRFDAGEPISPECLQRLTEFTALKTQELGAAQAALEESRAACESAHTSVVRHFEQLSVVQRLGKRREMEATREAAWRVQKRLDEQALSRLSAAAGDSAAGTQEE